MGKRNTRNNKKADKRPNNDNDSEIEELITPKRSKNENEKCGSSQRSKRSLTTSKQKIPSCRRRLQEALNFARDSSDDENNNAIASPDVQLTLHPGKIKNNDVEASTSVKQSLDLNGHSKTKGNKQRIISKDHSTSIDPELTRVMLDLNDKSSGKDKVMTVVDPEDDVFDGDSCDGSRDCSSDSEDFERVVEINLDQDTSQAGASRTKEHNRNSPVDTTILDLPKPARDAKKIEKSPSVNMQLFRNKLKSKPEFERYMLEIFSESIQNDPKQPEPSTSGGGRRESTRVSQGKTHDANKISKVKSPSDTTIYRPALKLQRFDNNSDMMEKLKGLRLKVIQNNEDPTDIIHVSSEKPTSKHINDVRPVQDEEVVDEYVENIRLIDFPGDRPGTSGSQNVPSEQEFVVQQQERARARTNEVILQAERQKATNIAPQGNLSILHNGLSAPPVDYNFNDDNPGNFCQVSCHVDTTTGNKIKIGDFVEMAKIYPKNSGQMRSEDEGHIEFVSRGGKTYFVPQTGHEAVKINNVRSWERAFRVYAAIYTQANPHRAAEIYQYVHTINLASVSYSWDNVAYYDYHFRQLMAKNPQRSWAKSE